MDSFFEQVQAVHEQDTSQLTTRTPSVGWREEVPRVWVVFRPYEGAVHVCVSGCTPTPRGSARTGVTSGRPGPAPTAGVVGAPKRP